MYYKTFSSRLISCGWSITEETHTADRHYFRYDNPDHDRSLSIELVCDSSVTGKPKRILRAWQGGLPARV